MNMIRREDYPCEKHTVQTKDGYKLTLHRIPHKNAKQSNQKIILLMHGMYYITKLPIGSQESILLVFQF